MIRALRFVFKDWLVGRPFARRSSQWPKVRAAHLLREPYCQCCGSRESVEVHHVIPVHVQPADELKQNNLITLCDGVNKCHFRVGHHKHWDMWNVNVREDAARALRRRERLGA